MQKSLIPGEYYSPLQVASILGLAKSTVYEAVKRGDVETHPVGKRKVISGEDANAYFLDQSITGETTQEEVEDADQPGNTTRERIQELFAEEAKDFLAGGSVYMAHKILDLWNKVDDLLAPVEE